MKISLRALGSLVPPVLLLLLWEAVSRVSWIDQTFFPPPSEIVIRLVDLLLIDSTLLNHIYASLYRLAIGTFIAIPLAVGLAFVVVLNPWLGRVVLPLIAITYPMPKLAIFPFFLLIFGIGDAPKIALIAIGVFYLVLLSTIQGVEGLIASGFFDIVKVFRIPFFKRTLKVVVLGALPEILNGVKIGVGYGLVMVVASEFTVSNQGIGVFIWNAWDHFRIKDLYCGLLILSILGLILSAGLDYLKKCTAWKM